MDMTRVDDLVTGYLQRLDAAAAGMPPDRRAELTSEIAEHIDAARAAGADDEAAVRTVLDRLGDPAVIVAAAMDSELVPAVAPSRRPSVVMETVAVLLLTVGSIIILVGWVTGVLLLWVSRRWTVREKLLGTLVVPLGPFGLLFLGPLFPSQSCSSSTVGTVGGGVITTPEECTGFALSPWLGIPLLAIVVIAPFVVGGLLLRRARNRAAAEG